MLYHNPAEIPRNSSFALTATNLWNCLPPGLSLISNKSVDYFKNQLDKFLDIFPDESRCSASGQFSDPNTGRTTNSIWHLQSDPSIRMEINTYSRRLKYAKSMQGGPHRGNPPPSGWNPSKGNRKVKTTGLQFWKTIGL